MKNRKLLENTSIYAYAKDQTLRILKTVDLEKFVNLFVKDSILATIFSYFVGTVLVLFRSWNQNIPFVPLSIVQTVVIDVYFLAIVVLFLVCEYWICEIWCLIRKSDCKFFMKVIGRIFSSLIAILLVVGSAVAVGFFTNDFLSAVGLFCMAFLIFPGYFHLFMTRLSPRATIVIECNFILLFAYFLVYNVPMSAGGLAPQRVEYCTDDVSDVCQAYDYFGNYDGMLILKNGDDVLLEPIGRGVVKYKYEPSSTKSDRWGLIKTRQSPKMRKLLRRLAVVDYASYTVDDFLFRESVDVLETD